MGVVLIITAIILYALAISLNVLNFTWFNGCGMNTLINIINLISVIAITIV